MFSLASVFCTFELDILSFKSDANNEYFAISRLVKIKMFFCNPTHVLEQYFFSLKKGKRLNLGERKMALTMAAALPNIETNFFSFSVLILLFFFF